MPLNLLFCQIYSLNPQDIQFTIIWNTKKRKANSGDVADWFSFKHLISWATTSFRSIKGKIFLLKPSMWDLKTRIKHWKGFRVLPSTCCMLIFTNIMMNDDNSFFLLLKLKIKEQWLSLQLHHSGYSHAHLIFKFLSVSLFLSSFSQVSLV